MKTPQLRDDGGPAFPFKCQGATTAPEVYYGMTLRDYFAAKALNGWLASEDRITLTEDAVADVCYGYADAMIRERNKVWVERGAK